jgi:ABC-type antimicrobial peptide transport system permease subunit
MVLREGTVLVAAGVVAGIGLAWVCSRVTATLLYGIVTTDPPSFALAVVVTVLAGLSATIVPAWRAGRTDPIVVLREE